MAIIVYYLLDTRKREFRDDEFDAALAFAVEQLAGENDPDEDEEEEGEEQLTFAPHYAPDGVNLGIPVSGNEETIRAAYLEHGEVRLDAVASHPDGLEGKVLGENVRIVNSAKDEADQEQFERSAAEMGERLSRAYATKVTLEPLVPRRRRG